MPYDPEESKYLLHPVPGWLKLACPVHPVHSGENLIKGLGHSLEQTLIHRDTPHLCGYGAVWYGVPLLLGAVSKLCFQKCLCPGVPPCHT